MAVMVVVCYRPKPGKEKELESLVREHLHVLRAEGLVDETVPIAGRAKDGTITEVFCWKSQQAIDSAHSNPAVQELWGRFAQAADYTTISTLEEASQLFTPFEALDLSASGAPKRAS